MLPDIALIRSCLESIRTKPFQMACKAAYLFSGRISEVVSQSYGNEKVYGPSGSDVFQDFFVTGDKRFDVVVFKVKTAKRNGLQRNIGLPLDFEPWAKQLFSYFQEFGKDFVFPFMRQDVWREAKQAFKGLWYPIEKYVVWKDGKLEKVVEDHERSYTLHALRHSRTTELVEFYGFEALNLAAYCGWTITTAGSQFGVNVPKVISRYLYLNWQGYFPKLLKPRI